MGFYYNHMRDAAFPLMESDNDNIRNIITVLEDSESPVTRNYLEKLYDSIIKKSHVDFGDIPKSKGNIVAYSGYTNMIEILENLQSLANEYRDRDVLSYVTTIKTAIKNMSNLSELYEKAFKSHNEYVMLEYSAFVYTIVQSISALLYEFVDYVKRPNDNNIKIVLKNTKYRANLFYFEQLNKFNLINKDMDYRKYLMGMIANGRQNFTGVEVVGLLAVISVALAVVPLMRELVFRYYSTRSTVSDCLAQQAYFLELNKACVEANTQFSKEKKHDILVKQEKAKNLLLMLSEKLRVKHAMAINDGAQNLKSDNKLLTIDNIKKEVSDSPLQLL